MRAIKTRSGRKTIALATRRSNEGSFAGVTLGASSRGSARSAKATASSLEVIYRLVEMLPAEVGPQDVRDPEFRVCELPEQKVGDAQLAARSDEEVRIGQPVRVELPREEILVDLLGRDPLLPVLLEDASHRVDDFRTTPVGNRQHEDEAVIAGEVAPRGLQDLAAPFREEIHTADRAELDVIPLELLALLPKHLLQDAHEPTHLPRASVPVFEREGVEREHLDPQLDGAFDHLPHGAPARAVPHQARQPAALRPAPVSVHDDGDVRGRGKL